MTAHNLGFGTRKPVNQALVDGPTWTQVDSSTMSPKPQSGEGQKEHATGADNLPDGYKNAGK